MAEHRPGRQLNAQEISRLLTKPRPQHNPNAQYKFTEPTYAFSELNFQLIKAAVTRRRSTASRFRLRYYYFKGKSEVFISPVRGFVPCARVEVAKVLSVDRL